MSWALLVCTACKRVSSSNYTSSEVSFGGREKIKEQEENLPNSFVVKDVQRRRKNLAALTGGIKLFGMADL